MRHVLLSAAAASLALLLVGVLGFTALSAGGYSGSMAGNYPMGGMMGNGMMRSMMNNHLTGMMNTDVMSRMMRNHQMGGMGGGHHENAGSQYIIGLTWSPDPIKSGHETQFTVTVKVKVSGEPVSGATVVIGIESGQASNGNHGRKGGMMGGMMGNGMGCVMIYAEEQSPGVYTFTYVFMKPGEYTIHVHVIGPGGSMMDMMDNHRDFTVRVA